MRSTSSPLAVEHDDRHVVARAAQPAAHGQTVFTGQHEVEREMRRVALQLAVEVAGVGEASTWNPCSPR